MTQPAVFPLAASAVCMLGTPILTLIQPGQFILLCERELEEEIPR
ncbi:hypothetical protein J2Z22_002962 [Paenibacillus forsythiae]|uniref:Uncharacterized protein n=1 Tax=Paenibacillus forsythiae TaxID=365616 RepID=A0ABU3H9A9_9BACL|nr:hypothetical protein [Paenibacillus forsythiae]MDT3427399.1 hypothetical protein [Paenibacillus forsythiae]